MVFQQEGYDFMAAAFEVYSEIGYAMAEEIYQQSFSFLLSEAYQRCLLHNALQADAHCGSAHATVHTAAFGMYRHQR